MKGLALNEKYYREIVEPLLHQYDPQLTYSCGLIGYGSDVLGFDDATSMDHNWGPRLQIFLSETDISRKGELSDYFARNLPPVFLGFPTNFSKKAADATQRMEPTGKSPVNHLLDILEIDAFAKSVTKKPLAELTNLDWLSIPEQILLETTSGKIFHDGLGRLEPLRQLLRYYPSDVQILKLSTLWECISNEEAFLGRCIENSDYIGLKLITNRIVNYLMKICFVIKRVYIPYSKWFSKSFTSLGLHEIESLVTEVLMENDLRSIDRKVSALYMEIIELNNKTSVLPIISNVITDYHGRPYNVIMADKIVSLFTDSLEDETLKNISLPSVFVDNKVDSCDFTDAKDLMQRIVGI